MKERFEQILREYGQEIALRRREETAVRLCRAFCRRSPDGTVLRLWPRLWGRCP